MKEFKTKQEAETYANGLNINALSELKFCPLIKDRCKPECVCFSHSKERETKYSDKTVKWTVYNEYPGCDNAMFMETEINM